MTRAAVFPLPRVTAVTLLALLSLVAVGCAREPVTEAPDPDDPLAAPIPGRVEGKSEVQIDTEYGRIVVALYRDSAPRHVKQFLALVREGFYDGTTFHRVVPGFLIQGGDPNTRNDDPSDDGYGGLEDQRLELEIAEHLQFRRGTLGMARDHRPDGASTQFFITLGRASHIDGRYTIFGRVSSGLDVVDAIAGLPVDRRRRPETPVRVTMGVVSDPGETDE